MTEPELLFEISSIVTGEKSFAQAVDQIALLLEREAHVESLVIDQPGGPDAIALMESFDQPYRSLFTVDLRAAGNTFGKVTLCFASDHFLGCLPQRLSHFVGEQLGMLVARTRLSDRRAHMKHEIARIKKELATRKLMQRAEGILIDRRGLTARAARKWIAMHGQRTGLSANDVAHHVIAHYQAAASEERRIA